MQVKVDVRDGVVLLATESRYWAAGLTMAKPGEVVLAPLGMLVNDVSSFFLRLESVTCGMCDEMCAFEMLTKSGQQRAHRRIYRLLTDLKHRTLCGRGRIVCKKRGQGEHGIVCHWTELVPVRALQLGGGFANRADCRRRRRPLMLRAAGKIWGIGVSEDISYSKNELSANSPSGNALRASSLRARPFGPASQN